MRLCQVAISVASESAARAWYRGLGFADAGRYNSTDGAQVADTLGLPVSADMVMTWMVDSQDFFQLEVFEFHQPAMRPRADQRRISDIGFAKIGIHVSDFEGTLDRLQKDGTEVVASPAGPPGYRRAVVLDPDGNLVEIMEDDPRAIDVGLRHDRCAGTATRSIALSVRDLDSCTQLLDAVGCQPADAEMAAAGGSGAQRSSDTASRRISYMSGDFLIEVAEFSPEDSRPWPQGYLLSDQGILNIAFGTEDLAHYNHVVRGLSAQEFEMRNGTQLDGLDITYAVDKQGFAYELMYWAAGARPSYGFTPE